MDFGKISSRYENELTTSVIPFWENHCIDKKHGGFFTMLDREGTVYDTEKFMWMQWRIVYMFATLAESRFAVEDKKEKWIAIAKDGYDFLTKYGKADNGHYYFVLKNEGTAAVAPYNIYSECFASMGAAALYKATGEQRYFAEAMSAMNHYKARIADPKGIWNKELVGRPDRLSFGNYMILANLGQVVSECLGVDDYLDDIRGATDTVVNKFWNSDLNLMFENVNTDGHFDMDSCLGRHIIPGHGLEAMWFIMQYAEKIGDTGLIQKCCDISKHLLGFGWDKEHGGLYYFMDALNKPHFELEASMKLWWVHNEAIIATLYGYKLTGDKALLGWFEKLDDWTWSNFPDPEHGEWFGYLNRDGKVSNQLKGGRWKTFFHLPRFLHMSSDLLLDLEKNS